MEQSIPIQCIIIFVTQLIFIGFRAVNIKAIANKNIPTALISGAIIHLSWLISITIGVVNANKIMNNFEVKYIPVILCSLAGGLIGTYYGIKGNHS